MICGTRENSKKTLKFHLEHNFNNFQERKIEKFLVDRYNILSVHIVIIGFHVNILSELVFSIILHLFLLHILLEDEYCKFFHLQFFLQYRHIF